jgi:hypothetical protein
LEYTSNQYILYKLWSTNKPDRVYIGITNNANRRRLTHFSIACGSHHHKYYNKPLYKAIRILGKDSFVMEVLEEGLTLSEVRIKERQYIVQYNSLYPNGYNLL